MWSRVNSGAADWSTSDMVRHRLNAVKKRAKDSRSRSPIRDALLKPTTWKAALLALDFFLKLVRAGAKIWDMLT